METTTFEGFDYKISPKELVMDVEHITLHDDGSSVTGDVYGAEIEFNEEMKKAEKNIMDILKECE